MGKITHPTRRDGGKQTFGGLFANVHHSVWFPPAVIFVAIIVATIFGWQSARTSLDHDITMAANTHADTAAQSLQQHLLSYEQILRGGVGLFRGSKRVSSDEWQKYLSAFDVGTKHTGVQGVGFIKTFTIEELPAVQADMQSQGVANFQLWPAGPARGNFAAVIYLQDMMTDAAPTYGFDMYTEQTRRTSMLQARDSGTVAITPRIELLSNQPRRTNAGFNMYMPYFSTDLPASTIKERQSALRGYVYASFRANTFFGNIIGKNHNESIGYYVSPPNDDAAQILYTSPNYDDISKMSGAVHVTQPLKVYGQTWVIHYALDPHLLISTVQLGRPGSVLFFGAFSAVLVAIIVYLLLRSRSRDLNAQQERAVELAKDELLSLASHQLRTPATGVKQYVGMVLQGFAGRVPASQKKLLEKAYASNDRQLRIINEILHLAKIDSGRIVLAKQDTNLNDLVTDIANEQRPDIVTAKHVINVELPKRSIIVNVDVHMLRMAVENILSNAIKYTPRGGNITIHVTKRKAHAQIAITDTGVGIQAADISKIFRQFSRLENEMSQQVGGTGIGLYLSKHLVELHGGTIDVTSEPAKGSTFTISLPL